MTATTMGAFTFKISLTFAPAKPITNVPPATPAIETDETGETGETGDQGETFVFHGRSNVT